MFIFYKIVGLNFYMVGISWYANIDQKPLEMLGTLHTKTMNRLQLAMIDFDFKIGYRKDQRCKDFLSRSFIEIGAISALDVNWVHAQSKDNLSNLIKESLDRGVA